MKFSFKNLEVLVFTPDASPRHLLVHLLNEAGVQSAIAADDLSSALDAYAARGPNLCIVDASSKHMHADALAFGQEVWGRDFCLPIIFLTDAQTGPVHKAILGFPQGSILGKEVSKIKLIQALNFALLKLENQTLTEKLDQDNHMPEVVVNRGASSGKSYQLFFKVGDSFKRIPKEDISFFFAEDRMTYARVGNRNFPTSVQLKVIESALAPLFVRCHKKYVVNVSNIESLSPKEGKVKIGGERLAIGASYRKPFLNSLNLLR